MFTGPWYRAGNALISEDGTMVIVHRVVSDGPPHSSRFRIYTSARPVIGVEQATQTEEYNEFLALYESAQKLTAVLDQEWQSKLRRWAAQEAALAKEREQSR